MTRSETRGLVCRARETRTTLRFIRATLARVRRSAGPRMNFAKSAAPYRVPTRIALRSMQATLADANWRAVLHIPVGRRARDDGPVIFAGPQPRPVPADRRRPCRLCDRRR